MDARSTGSNEPPPATDVHWDTTAGSLVHRLFDLTANVGPRWVNPLFKFYVAAIAVTFLPLLIGALISSIPLITPKGIHKLPFLLDANVLYMLLVSFPSLAVLSASDQQVLAHAIKSVKSDGTITIAEADERRLAENWRRLFRTINLISLCIGSAVGLIILYVNYATYTDTDVGFWIADEGGHLLPVGYVFLYCIFVAYTLIAIYVVRNLAISLLLRSIVKQGQIHLLPLHPDKAGGLRPMGALGLRNQYALTIIGVNVVLFVFVSRFYLGFTGWLYGLTVAAIVAYLVLGPIVFLSPLLPFRTGMLESKGRLMSEIARRLRAELEMLRAKPLTEPITKDDEETVERLRKIGAVIDELPVWPFDAGTLRKFLTAYVIPIAGGTLFPAAKIAFDFLFSATPP